MKCLGFEAHMEPCRAFCLSLPQRPERFAHAEKALKAALAPIELEMFEGIYGPLWGWYRLWHIPFI